MLRGIRFLQRTRHHVASSRSIVNVLRNKSSIMCSTRQLQQQQRLLVTTVWRQNKLFNNHNHLQIILQRRMQSTTAAASTKKTKTAGDIFLDNLGTVFLSTIAMIILALVRSSKGTTNKTTLREYLEETSALDPFEIDDLRVANSEMDRGVFEEIVRSILNDVCISGGGGEDNVNGGGTGGSNILPKMTYEEFVSRVMIIMKQMKGEGFTIQLGNLLDRVVLSNLEEKDIDATTTTTNSSNDMSIMMDGSSENDKKSLDLGFLMVLLSLTLNGPVRERVEVLFNIMQSRQGTNGSSNSSSSNTNDTPVVNEQQVIDMVGFLQKSCQLAPDAQITESSTKYPFQLYDRGNPSQLVQNGKEMKKDVLSEGALVGDVNKNNGDGQEDERVWTCDDFHHLLRSRSVCAWGECYIKKKGLH